MNTYSNPKDWPEDFSHENGNYQCRCVGCGELFTGHKRRVVCKECAPPPAQIGNGLYRKMIEDSLPEHLDLMVKVWSPTPVMVDVFVGSDDL